MSLADYCKTYTVKIETEFGYGTGCLFQPSTEEYTYVLTAKHLFQNNDKSETQTEINDSVKIVRSINNGELTSLELYHHGELDLTIVKVELINGLESLLYSFQIPQYPTEVALFGYPKIRDEQNSTSAVEYKLLAENKVQLYRPEDKKVEIEPKQYQNHGSIIGFSGCGVFETKTNSIRLVGIEVSMADDHDDAEGRMLFIPLREFKSIIKKNALAELTPLCKTNFKYVVNHSFGAIPGILGVTKDILHDLAENSISNFITPIDVMNIIDIGQAILKDEHQSYIDHIHFWTVWLEFLVLNRFVSKVENGESKKEWLEKIFKYQHFLFLETSDWTTHLEDLIFFWRQNMEDKNKMLLVSSFPDTCPNLTILKGGAIVEQIGRASIVDVLDGENTIPHIAEAEESKDFTFSHIHGLIHEIISNSDQQETDQTTIIKKIKEVLNTIYNGN
jgi:hypothetical protein